MCHLRMLHAGGSARPDGAHGRCRGLAGGPALLFRRARGTAFPLLGNLFGTLGRSRFLFRDTLDSVRRLVELKADPGAFARQPWRYRGVPRTLWRLLPRRVSSGPILAY